NNNNNNNNNINNNNNNNKNFFTKQLLMNSEIMKLIIKKSLLHPTFDFNSIHFEWLVKAINSFRNYDLMKFLIIKSIHHPTFELNQHQHFNFNTILSLGNQYEFESNLIISIIKFLFHLPSLRIIELIDIIPKTILNIKSITVLKYYFNELINSPKFINDLKKNINLKEIFKSIFRTRRIDFIEFIIDYSIQYLSFFNTSHEEIIKNIFINIDKIKKEKDIKFIIEKIFNHPLIEFNTITIKIILTHLNKINNNNHLSIELIFDKLFENKLLLESNTNNINTNTNTNTNNNNNITIEIEIIETILFSLSKIKNQSLIESIIEKLFNYLNFPYEKSFNIIKDINVIEKILLSCIHHNNLFMAHWIFEKITIISKNASNSNLLFEKLLLYSSKINHLEFMSFLIKKLLNLSSLESFEMNQIDLNTFKTFESSFLSLILNSLIKLNHMKLFQYLIKHQELKDYININNKDKNQEYPLITLCFNKYINDWQIFEYLLDYFDINELDDYGYNILYYCIFKEDISTLKRLIDMGININLPSKNNSNVLEDSPINVEIKLKNTEIILLLISHDKIQLNPLWKKKLNYGNYLFKEDQLLIFLIKKN
ncbi:hypothetical protein BCR32DRAFT_306682, partial [Anaeromyces robustus]